MKQQVITLPIETYELLIAQIDAMPHALAKPLELILKGKANVMTLEATDAQHPSVSESTDDKKGGEGE